MYVSRQRRLDSLNRHYVDTAKLPTRLHELYPIDFLPMEGLPLNEEEDFYALDKISDRIIKKLEDVGVFLLAASFINIFSRNIREIYFLHKWS